MHGENECPADCGVEVFIIAPVTEESLDFFVSSLGYQVLKEVDEAALVELVLAVMAKLIHDVFLEVNLVYLFSEAFIHKDLKFFKVKSLI